MYILHTYIYIFTTSVKKFRYILGVNEGSIEIEMTRPVPTKVIPLKRSRTTDQEMCFWLGTPYESEEVQYIVGLKFKKRSSILIPNLILFVGNYLGWLRDFLPQIIKSTFFKEICFLILQVPSGLRKNFKKR